jgi:Phage head completion protein (GPL)
MSLTGKPQLTTNAPLANDGFWPELIVGDLVEKYRIPAEYDDGVVSWGLSLAIIRINQMLAGVRTQVLEPSLSCSNDAQPAPFASLALWAAAHSEMVDGEQVAIRMYKHAVFSMAKAFLLQQFNTMNRRPQAENLKKESSDSEEYWLNQAQWAMNWLFKSIAPCLETTSDFGVYVALL